MLRLCRVILLAALPALIAPVARAAEDPPEKKLKIAEGLMRTGGLADAEKLLLGIPEPSAKVLQLLGQIQVRLKRYEDALKTYERYMAAEKSASKRAAGETVLAELKTLGKTRFKITTTPPGATIYIDSKIDGPIGITPISRQVTPGRHKVMVELTGYEPLNVAVTAIDLQELELPFVLIPSGCQLSVTSQPDKAQVFIDGKGAGQTPIGRQLRSGTYRVEAILQPGEPPIVRQVVCDDKDPKPLQVHLASDSASAAPAPPAAPADPPKGAAKDTPKDAPKDAPKDTPKDAAKPAPARSP